MFKKTVINPNDSLENFTHNNTLFETLQMEYLRKIKQKPLSFMGFHSFSKLKVIRIIEDIKKKKLNIKESL